MRARVLATVALAWCSVVYAQTPSPALLILEKSDEMMAIADPATLKIVTRVPSGPDPHEIVASPDGKLAYISNYGGGGSALNTISVIDVAAQKPLSAISLGALHSAHGLAFTAGKLYFTAETNKVVGRYDPAAQTIDWVMGTGQDGTHMVWVNESLDRVVTSNVSSGTISIMEQSSVGNSGRKNWKVTNVWAGRGAEGFDISPDGKEIWAANAQDATVTIIDVASKRSTQTVPIPVQGANRLKFTVDGKRVLVSGLGGSGRADAVVLDAITHKTVKEFDLSGGSAGILMTPDGSRVFVAVSAKDKVAVIDLNTLGIAGYITTGKNPDGLAWAAQK